jgi:hypothetical protein
MSHELLLCVSAILFVVLTKSCDMYKSLKRNIHDPVISSQDESYTWYFLSKSVLPSKFSSHPPPPNIY